MKLFLLILAVCVAGCGRAQVSTEQTFPANQSIPSANSQTDSPTDDDEHEARLAEAEKQNAPFKIPPPHFAKTDFANFTYPTDWPKRKVTLENGKVRYDYDRSDRGWFTLEEMFFTDLTGDGIQEAIVFLSRVSCGVSCDGGSRLIYVYGITQNRPNLVWRLETGSAGYGCGLKEFHYTDKKIVIEVFSPCNEKMQIPKDFKPPVSLSKSYAYGFTRFVFNFDGKTFKPFSREFFDVGKLSTHSYIPLIRIS